MKLHFPGIKTVVFGRYGSLLLSLSVLLIYSPFVQTVIGKRLIDILFIAILVGGLRTIEIKSHFFRFSVLLLVVSLACGYIGEWLDQGPLYLLGSIGEVSFLILVALTILFDLFRDRQVTGDTLAGAVCVYMLLAMICAYLFLFVEVGIPGSFTFTQGNARLEIWASKDFFPFYYFSLVTLTTVGYGDMAPVSSAARTLATVEAMLGQVYLTILVARLVGMYLVTQQRETDK